MAALGYADTRPVRAARLEDGSWDEGALAENRRVVIRVFHDQEQQQPVRVAVQGEEAAQQPGSEAPARSPAAEPGLSEQLDSARQSAERIRDAFSAE
jgi:hypothetical protein